VIVSPDGILHHLPFELLETKSGRRLLESHVVSYVPSGAVLAVLRDRRAGAMPARAALAIGASPTSGTSTQSTNGDSSPGATERGVYDFDVSRLQPPPSANDEARSVAAALGAAHSVVLLGESATELDLKRQPLHDFRALHFAVHGPISAPRTGTFGVVAQTGR
jgi:CHAT domain-containing protein